MDKKKETKGELVPATYKKPSRVFLELDRMFDDFRDEFETVFFRPFGFRGSLMEPIAPMFEMTREPLVDLADMGDRFELTAEMPGIPKDKIDINVSDDGIEIKAEFEEETEETEKEYCCKERYYQSFYRKMALPDDVIPDKANAKMENGILKIDLPKKKPKEVPKMKKLDVE